MSIGSYSSPINEFVFGSGVDQDQAVPVDRRWLKASDHTGADTGSSALAIASGRSTGEANGGNIEFYISPGTTSGEQLNPYSLIADLSTSGMSIYGALGCGNINCVGITAGSTVVTIASNTSRSGLRLPHGTAPSSPTNGDIWTTTTGVYARISGSTVGLSAPPSTDIQVFTSDGTWTKPANAKAVKVICIGAGGGGGSGRVDTLASNAWGGAGGDGGSYSERTFTASLFSATVAVTVGVGGSGAARQTSDNSNGIQGSTGEDSLFGTFITAEGGAGGLGGVSGGTPISTTVQYKYTLEAGGIGGNFSNSLNGVNTKISGAGGGAGCSSNAAGNAGDGGTSNNSGTTIAGGVGSYYNGLSYTNATNGNAAPTNVWCGGSGGGGGLYTIGDGAGANGGLYGGAGGGGGGVENGQDSGAGGNGANGLVVVITYF